MKKILLFTFIQFCFYLNGQNLPKTDTIFSVKYNYDRIENSKISSLLMGMDSKCKTPILHYDRTKYVDGYLNYNILLMLKGFNKFTNSIVFSDYKYIIFSGFCDCSDMGDEIRLIEFHFTNKSKTDIFKKKVDKIINDKEYYNYPNDKLFYYKVLRTNVCYLLISTQGNPNNEIFEELKARIEKLGW